MNTVHGWAGGRDSWLGRQNSLRNVVRQELVARQLTRHVTAPGRVLEIGPGQGTQAVRLARLGHRVTGVDPDERMREVFARTLSDEPLEVRQRVDIVAGSLDDLPAEVTELDFDLVCCHGVLMYLEDPRAAIVTLCERVAAGGALSILARNADALAMRPGLRRQWAEVDHLLDQAATRTPRYLNELGVPSRADRLEELASWIAGRRMHVEQWYGVRVLTDGAAMDEPAPDDPAELSELLDAEERVGRTDPYRRVAPLLHLVARRLPAAGAIIDA